MSHFTLKSDTFTLEEICEDRRHSRRSIEAGGFAYCSPGDQFASAPIVECTTTGARVILGARTKVGDVILVRLEGGLLQLEGEARVAWTQSLSKHRKVAGLEFLTVRRRQP